jgi:hypothetical protein
MASRRRLHGFWEWRSALLMALGCHAINSSAISVALALSTFADNRTGEARPSIATVAKCVGLTVNKDGDCSAVRSALKSLERAGLLKIERRGRTCMCRSYRSAKSEKMIACLKAVLIACSKAVTLTMIVRSKAVMTLMIVYFKAA